MSRHLEMEKPRRRKRRKLVDQACPELDGLSPNPIQTQVISLALSPLPGFDSDEDELSPSPISPRQLFLSDDDSDGSPEGEERLSWMSPTTRSSFLQAEKQFKDNRILGSTS